VRPLEGLLVVDFTWYLPGPFASRELLRLGARVVHVEPPQGDPMRPTAPAWHDAVNAGKESVVCDLKTEAGARACERALRAGGRRSGRLPARRASTGWASSCPQTAVLCAVTGFGEGNRHELRAGHDVNYLGWAGVLADTAPAMPPTQIADLAAGGLSAALEVTAALLGRERTGQGARIVVSMTHGSAPARRAPAEGHARAAADGRRCLLPDLPDPPTGDG
jgi:crotonobetainyl-CoA:carnitine CoA-transferase CaiB-like acyl-CoA transferase